MSNQPYQSDPKKDQGKKPTPAGSSTEKLKSTEYSVDKNAKNQNQIPATPSKNRKS